MGNPTKTEAREKFKKRVTDVPRFAYSIEEFCALVDISVSMYGKMRREGLTPREMRMGRRVLISKEAMTAWRTEREAASA
jgi:hypothetical protein